jgi:S1-C subfamily serine protease
VASGPVASWDIMMKDLTIFGVPVKQSVWNIIDLPSSSAESDGTVGFGFLKNFNVIVDIPRRHVWLENFSGKTADEQEGDVGMMSYYDRNAKRIVIWNVIPNSPAERLGVKRGDQVIGINGRDVSTLGWRQINDLLRGEPGSEVLVDLSRGGSLQRLTFKRELLVNQTL